jgi:sn-glycerol 3-phosphate transport system ATP-binding protein
LSAIKVSGVSKLWGPTAAVDKVSFTAEAGKLLVLLGPSGCGKSTTLRLIAGLEDVSGGSITIDGRDVTNLPSAKRGVSMVFQSYALFPHLSVAENIVFGLKVRNVPPAERATRLRAAAELLGLSTLLDRRPSQLSGGQQQRVALGRAIVAQTPVCLMDEPLSNLDAQLRHEMRREIRALQQKLNITMVYVTHDQTEAMTMADQVILMRNGRIEQDAPPAELYAHPATAFCARFIGTPPMNILTLTDSPAGAVIAGSEGPVLVSGAGAGKLLGVRPEDMRLAQGGGVAARVETVEYLGADSIIAANIGTQKLSVRVAGRCLLTPGSRIQLAWEPTAQHLFDAATSQRIDDRSRPAAIAAAARH